MYALFSAFSTYLIGVLSAHATKVPGLIFLSGQTPVDGNGVLVPGGVQEHTVCYLFYIKRTEPRDLFYLGTMHQQPWSCTQGCWILVGESRQG
jgi:hypothetical protein